MQIVNTEPGSGRSSEVLCQIREVHRLKATGLTSRFLEHIGPWAHCAFGDKVVELGMSIDISTMGFLVDEQAA